ncbi:hypothetical protein [Arthrobacter koreensis]|uniref:hypothetical protein n=1 Tax=Arthrobacter koreensis TaxID=199136 RepID=UPI002DBCC266|nr:hypothetical protein [Arthrobacter koreensis]
MERFRGYIAGLGTASGTRLVVGHWPDSPFGPFTDVMVENRFGSRLLLAPSEPVARYVSSTYSFDAVDVVPVSAYLADGRLSVDGGPLRLTAVLGPVTLLGRLLEAVPAPLAVHPLWLQAVNPLARLIVRGVRTAGTTGDRLEFYGVRSIRRLASAQGFWNGEDLGPLAPVSPPVRFGFSSVPARPQILAVTTTITARNPAQREGIHAWKTAFTRMPSPSGPIPVRPESTQARNASKSGLAES